MPSQINMSTNVVGVEKLPGPVELVYVDNPWPVKNGQMSRQAKGEQFTASRGAARNYRLSRYDELISVGQRVAQGDRYSGRQGCQAGAKGGRALVAKAYGFEEFYTLGLVWVKQTSRGNPWFGQGYFTRSGCEIALVWRRGKPKVASRSVRQVHHFPGNRDIHSRKPPEFLDILGQLCTGIKLEMYATLAPEKPGWYFWGNKCPRSVEL